MYQPTKEQVEIYGLKRSQGRLYNESEICAGIFRANTGRKCQVKLMHSGNFISGYVYADEEGNCYATAGQSIDNGVYIFIASMEDASSHQRKISELTILVEEEQIQQVQKTEEQVNEKDEPAGSLIWPFPAETVRKLLFIGPNFAIIGTRIITSLVHYSIIFSGIYFMQNGSSLFGFIILIIGVELAVINGGVVELIELTFKIHKK